MVSKCISEAYRCRFIYFPFLDGRAASIEILGLTCVSVSLATHYLVHGLWSLSCLCQCAIS